MIPSTTVGAFTFVEGYTSFATVPRCPFLLMQCVKSPHESPLDLWTQKTAVISMAAQVSISAREFAVLWDRSRLLRGEDFGSCSNVSSSKSTQWFHSEGNMAQRTYRRQEKQIKPDGLFQREPWERPFYLQMVQFQTVHESPVSLTHGWHKGVFSIYMHCEVPEDH